MAEASDRQTGEVPARALLPFFAAAFAIAWGLLGAYIAFPEAAASWLGPLTGTHPVFFLATWAPALAGLAIVLAHGGLAGLGRYLSRLLIWRCPTGWVLFVLFGIPLLFAAGAAVKGEPSAAFAPGDAGAVLAALAFMLFLGPIEEFGWRGVAQPLLQRLVAPLWAGALIGAVWGLWHLPAFHLSGTVQSAWSFWPFFAGNVALAVIVTPLFNATGGSLLWPMLLHWQLINPLWPEAQPYDIPFFVAAAVAVIWFNRRSMLTRAGAATTVIPAERSPRPAAAAQDAR